LPNHLDQINEPKPALNLVSRSIPCLHLRIDDSETKNSHQASQSRAKLADPLRHSDLPEDWKRHLKPVGYANQL